MNYIKARLSEASTWKAIILGGLQIAGAIQPQYLPIIQVVQGLVLGHMVVAPDTKK